MTLRFLPPAIDAYEAAVDDAIITCNGDLRTTLKALIIANEFLERDLDSERESPTFRYTASYSSTLVTVFPAPGMGFSKCLCQKKGSTTIERPEQNT